MARLQDDIEGVLQNVEFTYRKLRQDQSEADHDTLAQPFEEVVEDAGEVLIRAGQVLKDLASASKSRS